MTTRRGIDPALIHAFLRRCEHNHWSKMYMALIGGAVLALLGPLVITFSFLLISMSMIMQYGFWITYLIIAAVSLPLMFLVAHVVKGSILENSMPDGDSFGGRFVQRRVATVLVVAELANIGPRLVLWSLSQMRGRKQIGEVDLHRMVDAVSILSATDGGIGPVKLLKGGESADHLAPLLAVLLFYDIVDMSNVGDRVWLSSHAKEQILAEGKRGFRTT